MFFVSYLRSVFFFFFFFNDTATTEIYTLSLHDALPISLDAFLDVLVDNGERNVRWTTVVANHRPKQLNKLAARSEEHTSELQSPCNLVCRLLLEKKKKKNSKHQHPRYKETTVK